MTLQFSRMYWKMVTPRFPILIHQRYLTSKPMLAALASSSQPTANICCNTTNLKRQTCSYNVQRNFTTSMSKLTNSALDKELTNIFSEESKSRAIKRMKNTKPLRTLTKDAKRFGAVCIPLCVIDGEPAVLYTLRTVHLSTHRGEVSFPGGMADPDDRDLNHTALRELEEEIGVPMESVEIWGSLIPLPDKTRKKAVTPIVGFVRELDLNSLKLNEGEVEEVFTLSLKKLCTTENQRYTHFQARGPNLKSRNMPVFLGGPHRIWGLTAIITDQMLRVLLPYVYKSAVTYREFK